MEEEEKEKREGENVSRKEEGENDLRAHLSLFSAGQFEEEVSSLSSSPSVLQWVADGWWWWLWEGDECMV